MLKFNLELISESLGLPEDAIMDFFNDGRKASFVIEHRLVKEYTGGERSDSENSGWDIKDRNGNKWEVRSLTKFGVYFCPSYMVGSGRKFDEEGFLEKLDGVVGYLITDITQFPDVPVYRIPTSQVLEWYESGELGINTKLSYKKAAQMFSAVGTESLPEPPISFRDIANAE